MKGGIGRIAGIFYCDGRPIRQEDENWVLNALGFQDKVQAEAGLRRAAGLLMGMNPAPQQHPDCAGMPCGSSTSGASFCTLEGRLDSRGQVLRHLGLPLSEFTDSELGLRLYHSGGIESFRELIGDWSLGIWDAGRRAILLASDYAGNRPLYYHVDSHCLLWSSSLASLPQGGGTQELDDEYVASFLSRGNACYRTPYRGIFPVPPGQVVLVTAERVSKQSFWSLPFHEEVRFQNPRDYEDRLRALFQEAVSVRLSPGSPVCAELSGGMDSSSVVSMAHRVLAEREPPGSLVTFSYESATSTDTKYIRAVERAIQNSGIHLDLNDHPFLRAEQPGEAAPLGWAIRFAEVAQGMAAIGSTVLLTGQLGDFLMGGLIDDAEQVVDHLQRGHLLEALREAFAWSQYLRVPIYSILWRALRTNYSSFWSAPIDPTGLRGVHNPYANVDSLAPEFRKRVSFDEIERLRRLRWQDARPGQRRRFRILSDTLESRSLQAPEPLQHICFTHPFAHRPLVEFMMTIPPAEVCRPGKPRRLMRQAFAGILPPAISARKSKASYTEIYRQSLVPLARKLLERPDQIRLVELGYLDAANITDRLVRLTEGLQCNESQLRHVILLEFWLRKREAGASHSGDSANGTYRMRAPSTSVEPPPQS